MAKARPVADNGNDKGAKLEVHNWVRTGVTVFVFVMTVVGAIVLFNGRLVALETRAQNFVSKAAFTALAKDIEYIKEKQEEILDIMRTYARSN